MRKVFKTHICLQKLKDPFTAPIPPYRPHCAIEGRLFCDLNSPWPTHCCDGNTMPLCLGLYIAPKARSSEIAEQHHSILIKKNEYNFQEAIPEDIILSQGKGKDIKYNWQNDPIPKHNACGWKEVRSCLQNPDWNGTLKRSHFPLCHLVCTSTLCTHLLNAYCAHAPFKQSISIYREPSHPRTPLTLPKRLWEILSVSFSG